MSEAETAGEMREFWRACLGRFHGLFAKEVYDAFIKPVDIETGEDGALLIRAPNEATRRWLSENLGKHIAVWLRESFTSARPVRYQIRPATAGDDATTATTTTPTTATAETEEESPAAEHCDALTGLRADHTFANFVPGHSNEIALSVAQKIAVGDVRNVNPFFLHGSTGLGKTHLVQAIGNRYRRLFPSRRVRYISSRDFMNDVINACRHNRHDTFREFYGRLDLLIVDDIQYIGGDKTRTQEEFFTICNRCSDSGRMIVITSDSAPAGIQGMPQRLVSRFAGGLPIAVRPPELELRAAILHKKAAAAGIRLQENVARFIAEKVKSNVRELEGALKRVIATATFRRTEPTLALCEQTLSDLFAPERTVHIEDIIAKVAEYFRLRRADLTGKRRLRSIVEPRQIAMFLARETTNMSFPQIGENFGGRNHATVIHACRKIEAGIQMNAQLRQNVQTLEMLIKS